jgi:hypothetical protein
MALTANDTSNTGAVLTPSTTAPQAGDTLAALLAKFLHLILTQTGKL